jgi:hypothetical protein
MQTGQLLRDRSYPSDVTAAPTKVHPSLQPDFGLRPSVRFLGTDAVGNPSAGTFAHSGKYEVKVESVSDEEAREITEALGSQGDKPGDVKGPELDLESISDSLREKFGIDKLAEGLKDLQSKIDKQSNVTERTPMAHPTVSHIRSDAEIETAIIAMEREPGGGLVVMGDPFTVAHRAAIISAAARNNVPAVYGLSYFARDGGLLSYGVDLADNFRRAASYVDRILRGAKPGDLPVQFPVKYEMAVNRKTAKALGLEVPLSILVRADEVIE